MVVLGDAGSGAGGCWCVVCGGGGVSSAVVGGGASSLVAVWAVPLVVVHRGGRCGAVGLLLLWLVGAMGVV